MKEFTKKVPYTWWFLLALFSLIWPMFVGPYIAISNPNFFGGTEVSELTLSSTLYIARNLAVGLAFLLAIYLRNAHMLFILIVIRLLTDLVDDLIVFSGDTCPKYKVKILKMDLILGKKYTFKKCS